MRSMRYLYTFDEYNDESMRYNAGQKCPADILHFIIKDGAEVHHFDYLQASGLRRYLKFPGMLLKMMLIPSAGSDVVCVYPYNVNHPTLVKVFRMIAPVLHAKKVRLCAVVVDTNSIRFNDGDIRTDIVPLNCFDHLVLHSETMRDILVANGLKTESSLIGLIDYAVNYRDEGPRSLSHEVCFAGNLHKSAFLRNLDGLSSDKLFIHLYGGGYEDGICQDRAVYEGKFLPDDLRGIKGSWGLVWDGDSIDGISGYLGRYLGFNSPHKASMYICAGLPLIAPEGTHTADVVKEHGLGLVVSSLNDMDAAIDAVTEEEYARILDNVEQYAERLMNGRNLLDALKR